MVIEAIQRRWALANKKQFGRVQMNGAEISDALK